MKKLILLLAALMALKSFGETDYNLMTSVRGYPQGLSLTADLGKSLKLWGKDSGVLYGYMRPAVNFQTSALVNYATARVELFPISFLGAYYAQSKGWRSVEKLQGFDCENLSCDSGSDKTHYGINAALAFGNFKLVNFYNVSDLEYETDEISIAEELSNLVVEKEDTLKNNISVIGYQVSSALMLGVLNSYYVTEKTKQSSNMLMGLGAYTKGKWVYQMGLGNFHSRDNHNHFSALLIVKWNGEKGLKLF